MAPRDSSRRRNGKKARGNIEKIEWKLSYVNTRLIPRGQNELIGDFKMAADDVISILMWVMKYAYFPMGSKREFVVRFIYIYIYIYITWAIGLKTVFHRILYTVLFVNY